MSQACCVCFAINCKLYPMTAHRILKQIYETLTGLSDEDNLSKCLCHACARRLVAFSHFRDKCLRAHTLMLEVCEKYDKITTDTIQSLNGVHTSTINDHDQYDFEDFEDVKCEEDTLNRLLNDVLNNIKTENNDINNKDVINENDDMVDKEIINGNDDIVNKDLVYDNRNMINNDIINGNNDMVNKDLVYDNRNMINNDVINGNNDIVNKDLVNDNRNMINNDIINGNNDIVNKDLVNDNRNIIKKDIIHEQDDFVNKDFVNGNRNMINNDIINGNDDMIDKDVTNDNEIFYVETLDLLTLENEMASNTGNIKNLLDSHLPKIQSNESGEDRLTDDPSGLPSLIHGDIKKEVDIEMINYNYELVHDDMENDAVENEDCPDKTREDISHRRSSRLRHIKTYSSEKPYSSTGCARKFCNEKEIIEHSKTCSRCKYSCDMCKKMFMQKKILYRHIMRVHPSNKEMQMITCNVCKEEFSSVHKINMHLNKHFRKNKNSCQVCNKLFKNNKALNMHLLAAHKDGSYSCHICKEKFTGIEGLQAHLIAHSKETKPCSFTGCTNTLHGSSTTVHCKTHAHKNYVCDECKKEFYVKAGLVSHMQTHKKNKAGKTVCEVCGKIIRTKAMLKHLKAHEKHSCQFCMQKFKTMTQLEEHNKKAHAISYLCKICNIGIKNKLALLHHLKLHDGEKAYSCAVCDASYSKRCSLMRHFRTHKVDNIAFCDKFYVCEVCNQAFREQSELDNHHRASHKPAKPKPFMCDICKRSFPAKFNLYKHMTIHSSKKPYPCKICGKEFSRKFSLDLHMRVHSDEKPYSCNICKRNYRTKCYLRVHIGTVHRGRF